ncbi:MAG: LexA family transcriptional regulator [Clostridia bacterium]|nr:LexA family transcriptional regulator [Clostridia bacterium]
MNYSVLERLMAAKGITAYRLAKDTGIAFSSLSDWKKGRSSPKADKLALIADYFEVPVDFLLDQQRQNRSGGKLLSESLVPLIGEIRAGSPIITDQTLEGYELADLDDGGSPDDYFFLRIRGDSMKDIGMVNGSVVLFRKQQYADNGQVVACLVGGESATVKRFHREGRKILLMPENPEYRPIEISPVDFETGDARILGVATEIKIKL